jgi:hypothetical protein
MAADADPADMNTSHRSTQMGAAAKAATDMRAAAKSTDMRAAAKSTDMSAAGKSTPKSATMPAAATTTATCISGNCQKA